MISASSVPPLTSNPRLQLSSALLIKHVPLTLDKQKTMHTLLFNLGPSEIMLVAVAILVFFGGKKIPELMKGLGQGIREFNNAKANIETEVKEGMKQIDDKAK